MTCQACGADLAIMSDATFCPRCGTKIVRGDDPRVGSLIGGRYRLVGIVAEGGMGRIYSAEQSMGSETRRVAVKMLRKEVGASAETIERFRRECGIASRLAHPNAVQVFDFGTTESGELYIAMELVDGASLATLIRPDAGLPAQRIAPLLEQLCSVVDEAHVIGVVHRDLKPENILVTHDRRGREMVKVLDFGIALPSIRGDGRAVTRLTQIGAVVGTPPYMSPEQFVGATDVDARADIYALGVITYELVTGRLPFDASDLVGWATQHLTAQPFPIEATAGGASAPASFRSAIAHALAKQPAQRPSSARAFYEELARDLSPASAVAPSAAAGPAKTELATPAPELKGAWGGAPSARPSPSISPPAEIPLAPDKATRSARTAVLAVIAIGAALLGGFLAFVMLQAIMRRQSATTSAPVPSAATPSRADVDAALPPVSVALVPPPVEPSTPPLVDTPPARDSSPAVRVPPPALAPTSTCEEMKVTTDCARMAALKPRCAQAHGRKLHDDAHAQCAKVCPQLCTPEHHHHE